MTLSTIKAQLKKGYEPYFLVECDFDGYYDRIANVPVGVSNSSGNDYFFDGRMLNTINYGATFNWESFSFNIGSIQIDRNNSDRFQDQELKRRLDGGICKLYIWCEGLTWQDIDPYGIVCLGTFEKVYHTKYSYVFNINELTKSDKYGLVPKITINDDTWPLHRKAGGAGSVSGHFVPLVFGDFPSGVIGKCVDTSSDYLYIVTSGIAKSVDADYTATTENVYDNEGITINAGNYEVRTDVDGLGNPCTLIDFTGNYASEEPISCSIRGITDGSGEYTGTAGTLLEHPSDIVRYLIDNFGSKTTYYIDYETFNTLKSLYPSLKMCIAITEQTSIDEVISKILKQVNCASTARIGGYQGIFIIDSNRGISAQLIADQLQIGKTATFEKTPERLICNKLIVQYKKNHASNAFEGEVRLDKENNVLCNQSYIQYGFEYEKTIQLDYIYDVQTATDTATGYINLFAFRHDTMKWQIPTMDAINIRRGDMAVITHEEAPGGWTEEPCILIEKKYKKNMVEQLWWRVSTD
jgi:hypothetical protein